MIIIIAGAPGQSVLILCLRALNNNLINNASCVFTTDRDLSQFGHMCPQHGRSLPEVTISWTAEDHTGCTGSG